MEEKNFEDLRNQFAILKEQLNKQEIVNDRLLRETMKAKKKDINSNKNLEYGCVLIGLVVLPLNWYLHTWSLPFTIATLLLLIVCAAATHFIHRPVDRLNFLKDDFATVARVMAKFKKQYDRWLYYVTPVILTPWIAWACYDFAWKRAPEGVSPWAMCIPIIVAGLIGLAIGLFYHFKAVNAAQDIIDEMENME